MEQPIRFIDNYGNVRYELNGQIHRADGPAITYPNGKEEWWQNGKRHRVDGPDGTEEFWLDGKKVDIIVHFLQRP